MDNRRNGNRKEEKREEEDAKNPPAERLQKRQKRQVRVVESTEPEYKVLKKGIEADYNAGGCSFDTDFSEDEQTPKPPVFIDEGLNQASRWHCEDMYDNGHFAHESSSAAGGMSFGERVSWWYDSAAVGENIAMDDRG